MKAKILVIDDEESLRLTFKTFLEKEGYKVITAEDYPSAFSVFSESEVDLIYADILLGKYSGIDILREVRKRGLHCPVIMITGEPNVDTAAEAVRLGAYDYLPKPVRKEALIRVTRKSLQHKFLEDEKNLIEAEKERYRCNLEAIFRSVHEAIVTTDTEMRVMEANGATGKIFHLKPGEIIGKNFGEIIGSSYKACHKVLQETLRTKQAVKEYKVEWMPENHPGQVVVINSSPLLDKDNVFAGAVLVIRDITRLTDLERELRERNQFHKLVGKSTRMKEIYTLLEDLAETETTVLIAAESGTGKELVAEALHYSSSRASKTLVKVNCSALPETLLESELFGHVKGAFTGAIQDKPGRFQIADGGTVLLDEIGDISPVIQLKLLRVLQEKEFDRVGDSIPVKVDVRIIASTNRDLKEKVRLGEFREDLYYRLKVMEISLPPLRERLDDIPMLVDHFCNMFNKRFKKDIDGISDDVLRLFMEYPWPGNIRELEHALEHAFVLCHDRIISIDHLPADIRGFSPAKDPIIEETNAEKPENIINALQKTGWNKAKAARLLGISRQTIYRKIKELGIPDTPEELKIQ